MSEKRLATKVGIFIFIGLVLVAALMIYFSKAQSVFTKRYTVFMVTPNVGGLKEQASVQLSGVEIGRVESITLTPDGRTAQIKLTLQEQYKIHADAQFKIAAMGFLGDQYVSVRPTENALPILTNNAVVQGKGPLEIEELAADLRELVPAGRKLIDQLNESLERVDRKLLNEQNLTNLSLAITNVLTMSQRAVTTVDKINFFFETNTVPLNTTMTNLSKFSEQLNTLADELNQTVATNQEALSRAMNNLDHASLTVAKMMDDVNAGKGVAGGLIHDEQLKSELTSLVTNLNGAAANFKVFGSNLNSRGLWSVLWRPKEQKESKKERTTAPAGRR